MLQGQKVEAYDTSGTVWSRFICYVRSYSLRANLSTALFRDMWLQERVANGSSSTNSPFFQPGITAYSTSSFKACCQPCTERPQFDQQTGLSDIFISFHGQAHGSIEVMTTTWITFASYNCHMRYMYIVHHSADV